MSDIVNDGRRDGGPDHRERAALVERTASELAAWLDEVRLPLHILLSDHFGELNENQEEMLGAAYGAATEAAAAVERLRAIVARDPAAAPLDRTPRP